MKVLINLLVLSMYRFFVASLVLSLVCSAGSLAFAQETLDVANQNNVPPGPSLGATSEPTGPLNCFDYYTFGSVQADIQPTLNQSVPGASLTFVGDVVNSNNYPIVDGTLFVKIFKRSEGVFAVGDGNPVIDQFIVKEGITVAAGGKVPVTYEWKVPVNAEGGDYYAAYFFTTSKRYNLMGLSFTDDVVGNQAPFVITNTADPKTAKLSKIETTLNGKDHHFAAFPLHFNAGEEVVVETTITNPSAETKVLPVQWNQYAWDAMNPDNLRNTKTEVVKLAPNETKKLTYTVIAQPESVVYVVAAAQDNQSKSYLNIRFVQDGIEETRINFPSLTSFPLKKGEEQTLFACAHSTNAPIVPGNVLTLTLKDKAGNTIHQYKYEGDIAGAMSGFGEKFTPEKNVNYATLTATLERGGKVVEEITVTYDCQAIDPGSCSEDVASEAVGVATEFLQSKTMTMVAGGVVVLLLIAIALFIGKRRKSDGDSDHGEIEMTKPIA
jgi:hypothetical protein